jgi:hypothetical protein
MKAIETLAKTDSDGLLKISIPTKSKEKEVRIIVLISEDSEDETDEESLWLKSITNNPSFEFLNDESEDIYSLSDGVAFND